MTAVTAVISGRNKLVHVNLEPKPPKCEINMILGGGGWVVSDPHPPVSRGWGDGGLRKNDPTPTRLSDRAEGSSLLREAFSNVG